MPRLRWIPRAFALAALAPCAALALAAGAGRAQEAPAAPSGPVDEPAAAVTAEAVAAAAIAPSSSTSTPVASPVSPPSIGSPQLFTRPLRLPSPPAIGLDAWVEPGPGIVPFRLAPSVGWEAPRSSISLIGLASRTGRDLRYQGGGAAANVLFAGKTRNRGRLGERALAAELVVRATSGEEGAESFARTLRAEARGHLIGQASGLWITTGYEHADAPIPLVGLGGWMREQRMTLSWDIQQTAGALPRPGSPGRASVLDSLDLGPHVGSQRLHEQLTLTTARATVRFEDERIELESVGGVTFSPLTSPRTWVHATLAVRLVQGLALFGAAGNRDAALYAIQPSDQRGATLGVRLSGWRRPGVARSLGERAQVTSWRIRKLEDRRYIFEVRAPGARLVEVMGSMTGWEPVRLERVAGERWQTWLTIEPGVHQLNLRTDGGEWLPPPGIPSGADGFGGTVGVLIVE
jgi:hypothetical protein